jgi:hypothetical protein
VNDRTDSERGQAGAVAVDGARPEAGPDDPAPWNPGELAKLAAVLGRKWTPAIVVVLSSEPLRHACCAGGSPESAARWFMRASRS